MAEQHCASQSASLPHRSQQRIPSERPWEYATSAMRMGITLAKCLGSCPIKPSASSSYVIESILRTHAAAKKHGFCHGRPIFQELCSPADANCCSVFAYGFNWIVHLCHCADYFALINTCRAAATTASLQPI